MGVIPLQMEGDFSLGQALSEQQADSNPHQATVCSKETVRVATWNVMEWLVCGER